MMMIIIVSGKADCELGRVCVCVQAVRDMGRACNWGDLLEGVFPCAAASSEAVADQAEVCQPLHPVIVLSRHLLMLLCLLLELLEGVFPCAAASSEAVTDQAEVCPPLHPVTVLCSHFNSITV